MTNTLVPTVFPWCRDNLHHNCRRLVKKTDDITEHCTCGCHQKEA